MTGLADGPAGARDAGIPGVIRSATRRLPILMYHEITAAPRLPRRLAVCPDQFGRQLGYLSANGYTSLTAARAARLLSSGQPDLPPGPVVLTFDDGFGDFYDTAVPLLAECGITATLFVTTGWVDGHRQAGTGPRPGMLSWRQLEDIAAAGIEIGAHSEQHPQLDRLSPAALRSELSGCKHLLEDRLGQAVTGFSYPFGYSNRQVRDAAVRAGYDYSCAVGNRLASPGDDPYALPRLTVGRSTRLPGFARTVSAGRLPPTYLGLRLLTTGWAAVRRTRTALSRGASG